MGVEVELHQLDDKHGTWNKGKVHLEAAVASIGLTTFVHLPYLPHTHTYTHHACRRHNPDPSMSLEIVRL
jgi:hypothetical protein